MLILLRQGRLSKWFSGIGQEAIAVGVTAALQADDPILPLHRNLGVFTSRGLDLLTLCRQLLGRDGGYTGPKAGLTKYKWSPRCGQCKTAWKDWGGWRFFCFRLLCSFRQSAVPFWSAGRLFRFAK